MAKRRPKVTTKKPAPKPIRTAREGTKGAKLLGLLERPEGATIPELMQASGWQSHSIRGFMAGTLKKQGKKVVSTVPEGGTRHYKLGGVQ